MNKTRPTCFGGKHISRLTVTAGMALALLLPASISAGETINYPTDAYPLVTDPFDGTANSLFPASGPSDNVVSVSTGSGALGNAYGGLDATLGNVDSFNNRLTIDTDGTFGDMVKGGAAYDGNAYNNELTVLRGAIGAGGTFDAYVSGGFADNDGNVYGNTLTINGSIADTVINGYANGGEAAFGDVYNNTLIVNGGSITAGAYGGYTGPDGLGAATGKAYNNRMFVYGGQIGSSVAGGRSDQQGDVYNNTLTIEGGEFDAGASVYGGRSGEGNVYDNTLTISGGAFNGREIYGGMANGVTTGGEARGNKVFITSVTDAGDVFGGYSTGSNVYGNSVNISGQVAGNIYGGYTADGNATGNSLDIYGILDTQSVSGGYSVAGQATGNSVLIRQSAQINSGVSLFGGYSGDSSDAFSGNTLTIENRAPMTFAEIQYFENYNLTLPAGLTTGGTLITISGATPTYLANLAAHSQTAKFNLNVAGNDPLRNPGDYFTIISNTDTFSGNKYTSTTTGLRGIGVRYTYTLENQSDRLPGSPEALIATISGREVNPQTGPLVQASIAPALFLTQGGDFLVNQGLDAAIGTRLLGQPDECGRDCWAPRMFAVAGYGASRQDSDGRVKVNGGNFLIGAGFGNDSCIQPLNLAFFVEGGKGDYDSRGQVTGERSIKGKGDVSYIGGGLMGKAEQLTGNLYVDGSFRFGRAKSDYQTHNFDVPEYLGDRLPKFDLEGNYYGAHLGVGYIFEMTETVKLDLGARYLWTRLEGDSVKLLGDRFEFDDIDSHRLQAGGRLTWDVQDTLASPYFGAWYEYEFDGKAGGRVEGLKINGTDMKGSSGLLEAGVKLRPATEGPVFDLGVTGSFGQRESIGGHAGLRWDF